MTAQPGFLTRDQLVAEYARRTGRDDNGRGHRDFRVLPDEDLEGIAWTDDSRIRKENLNIRLASTTEATNEKKS